jgi:hypothetical protein
MTVSKFVPPGPDEPMPPSPLSKTIPIEV